MDHMATTQRNARSGKESSASMANQISSWLQNAKLEFTGTSDIDKLWEEIDLQSEIDGTLSAQQNYEIIKNRYGIKTKGEYQEEIRTARDQVPKHARSVLADNFDAIENGEKTQLVEDIKNEFGDGWVEVYLSELRQDKRAEAEISEAENIVTPNDVNGSSVGNAAIEGTDETPEPTPEPTPTPDPVSSPITYEEITQSVTQNHDPEPTPASEPVESPSSPGLFEIATKAINRIPLVRDIPLFVRYFVAVAKAESEKSRQGATETTQQSLGGY